MMVAAINICLQISVLSLFILMGIWNLFFSFDIKWLLFVIGAWRTDLICLPLVIWEINILP